MKQRITKAVFAVIALLFLGISCKKEVSVESASNADYKNFATLTSPDYSSNEYDDIGYYHNLAMDYIINNLPTPYDEQDISSAARTYAASIPSPWTQPNNQDAIDLCNDIINNGYDLSRITSSDFQNAASYTKFTELTNAIIGNDYSVEEYDDFKDLVTSWEDDIISDTEMPESDKTKLLLAGSVARWSGHYWIENLGTTWPNPNAKKWWQVLIADVAGSIIGFPLGGPNGSAIGAFIASSIVNHAS